MSSSLSSVTVPVRAAVGNRRTSKVGAATMGLPPATAVAGMVAVTVSVAVMS